MLSESGTTRSRLATRTSVTRLGVSRHRRGVIAEAWTQLRECGSARFVRAERAHALEHAP